MHTKDMQLHNPLGSEKVENAATNVSFPLVTITVSLSLLLGIGGAAGFSLALGKQENTKATKIAAGAAVFMVIFGFVLTFLVLLHLETLLRMFGAAPEVLPYAITYTGITAYGIPFFMFSTGFTHLIRADGSPKHSMFCVLIGAIVNTVLDPIFIFGLDMGIAGAAVATVIGQSIAGVLCFLYLFRFRSVQFQKTDFLPNFQVLARISSLGLASCVNQMSITVSQIVMNNTLTYYGASSVFGSSIPLAAVGVISKVNFIFLSAIIGISQGNQPIVGFNYGAKQYNRVRKTYKNALIAASVVAFLGFGFFQLFPQQIISLFGSGNAAYYQFATRYLRIFMMFYFLIGMQPVTSGFLVSIGKSKIGALLALSRQIIFLVPFIVLFPIFLGVDGVMLAGPVADIASAILAFYLVRREFIRMKKLEIDASI